MILVRWSKLSIDVKKYKLSPSLSPRFLQCTKSLDYVEQFSENKYTLKGSLIHEVAGLMLEEYFYGYDNSEKLNELTDENNIYVGRNPHNVKLNVYWDKEASETVLNYIAYIKALAEKYPPKTVYIEHKIKMVFYDNEMYGTLDFAILTHDNLLIVVDLKTGRNKVDIDDNSQMLLYAYGLMKELEKENIYIDDFIIAVSQSIIYNVKALQYTRKLLCAWHDKQAFKMEEINSGFLEYDPSPIACKYCPFRERCVTRINKGVR